MNSEIISAIFSGWRAKAQRYCAAATFFCRRQGDRSMDMSRQTFGLEFQLLNQGGVVFLYRLAEQSLLWAMAF